MRPRWERASRSEVGIRDALSARDFNRKRHPILSAHSGTQFPLEVPPGKRVPFWSQNPGHGFRLELIRKRHPTPRPKSGTRFPPGAARESVSHSEHQFRSALRYPRSHISANEISLVSPLLAAVSWHLRVKPRCSSILLRTYVRYSCL